MKPKVVTFDAANTLVRVRWTPGGFALDCARESGLELGEEERASYESLLRSRWAQYREINMLRDPERGDAFWLDLTRDWLKSIGRPMEVAARMRAVSQDLLYGPDSDLFRAFDDVIPALDLLDSHGIRLGVISNWDYTLHRVLRALDLTGRFEYVFASLEEGIEKPDPRLFHLALARFGARPDEAVHVGDDPIDDFRGAQDAGIHAFLIDRRHQESRGSILATLLDLGPSLGLASSD